MPPLRAAWSCTPPPCTHTPTAVVDHTAGPKHPFPFHLHISIVEKQNDLAADHRAPEPSTYSTNLNPAPAWRQSCTQRGFFWRETCLRESIFGCSLNQMLWRKGRKAQSVSHSPPSLASSLAGAMKHNHNAMSLMQHQQRWTVLRCHVHRSSALIISRD